MSSPARHDPVPPSDGSLIEIESEVDGIRWKFDAPFLQSNWTCIWGRGCQGILDHEAEALEQGCCSVGAETLDDDEAMLLSALAPTIAPARFQYHERAAEEGIFAPTTSEAVRRTAVVDGACIFLNRPGFSGGTGCALHLEADANGESPIDWKPSVCWQLPIRVERWIAPDGHEVAEVRRWRRSDWGSGGEDMAWCCTEEPAAYVGHGPVVEQLGAELEALVGREVYVELRQRTERRTAPPE